MPTKKDKIKVVESIRHSEYYNMVDTFDELYRKSKEGKTFDNLMDIIFSEENIKLAYREIKANKGSQTPGTDKLTMKDIGKMTTDEVVKRVRFIMSGSKHGYRPKPVRRKEIPKPNGSTRPLGIPCIWDRLIQQCIKQVMEPICEAKFSKNSYGFRPNRCVEHAIAETHRLMQRSHLSYVVEFDIKGFFDNVNHSKLIKQIWALGIHDKKLIFIIKRILTAPIRLPNGDTLYPDKGTPQGGIISPILANIVLNELDHWIDSQWLETPVIDNFDLLYNKAGKKIKSNAYKAMRNTKLKEMYIIRYADDFRIFCRNYEDACKAKLAITEWLETRLKLEISEEKTRVVNLKHEYMEFLGFKLKLYNKGNGWKVKSHVSDKKLQKVSDDLKYQFAKIAHAKNKQHTTSIVRRYNSMVLGVQNYYNNATDISKDFRTIQHRIDVIAKSRLHVKNSRKSKLSRKGRGLTEFEKERYGKSKALRYIKASGEPIYPIGYVSPKPPISKLERVCPYTPEGREGMHNNLKLNTVILIQLMKNPSYGASTEFNDNKLSLYSAQRGKCGITQRVFHDTSEIHCHHKTPREHGGNDKYQNLILVLEPIHKLIHATTEETIDKYLKELQLTEPILKKVNKYRKMAHNEPIDIKSTIEPKFC